MSEKEVYTGNNVNMPKKGNQEDVSCNLSKPGSNEKTMKKTKFTCKQKVALIMLTLADFTSVCSMSIIAPFYPAEATKRGISESVSGLVFASYALVVFIASPVFGKVIPKFSVKFIFLGGLLVSGVSTIVFGAIDRLDDPVYFVGASVAIRAVEALGASAYSTAGYVLVIDLFPEQPGAVRGLLETFMGLGLCTGPGIGGLLYGVGGFGLPFYAVGVATTAIGVLNFYLLPEMKTNRVEKSGSLISLLKIPAVLITCLIMIVTAMTSSFIDPTLEPHLRKFGMTPSQVGFLFLLEAATYGISSPLWGWLSNKMHDYSWLMTTGLFCSALTLLFLEPSLVLKFLNDSILLKAIALAVLGVVTAMVLIPTYQYIMDSATKNGFPDTLGTQSVIAGLWSSVYSLGEVIGPVAGATMMEYCGFSTTSVAFAFINLVGAMIALVYFKMTNLPVKKEEAGIYNATCYRERSNSINNDSVISIRL